MRSLHIRTSWKWVATTIHVFTLTLLPGLVVADTRGTINRLEELLFEGPYLADPAFGFPCQSRDGTTTAAQWLRLGYHDMSTHNIDDGTGGLDASIVFELDRPQNVGLGMRETINDLSLLIHPDVSFADIIAFAVVRAVANCGDGPTIPLRGGRVDATSVGPETVPEPHQDLASHTESFRRQGFTQSEMIALVACGHTVGGVRREDFPDVIHNKDVEFELFDGTDTFDHAVVQGYLDGTTSNPLVVGPNSTTNSDLRIFASDGNVTMQRLAVPDTFNKTCGNLFERMINTVPSNVVLTDVVTPIQYKVRKSRLFVASDGSYTFSAALRLKEFNSKRKVKLFWHDRQGSSVCPTSGCSVNALSIGPVHVPLLTRQRYGLSEPGFQDFMVPETTITNAGSISNYWLQIDEGDGSEPVVVTDEAWSISQTDVLVDPRRTIRNSNRTTDVVVAVRGEPSSISILTWERHDGVATPNRKRADLSLDMRFPPVGGYRFFSGNVEGTGFPFVDVDAQIGGETVRVRSARLFD
ncbi:hypothetical protein PQX77_006875 [Marasmius sp. AFHP31]|nr:hypothetical protein PQX77_006875 [Marasmius sp. AFHP31]